VVEFVGKVYVMGERGEIVKFARLVARIERVL